MKITIKYFGKLVDIMHKDIEILNIEFDSLNLLIQLLNNLIPELQNHIYAIFINNKKAEDLNITLKENDEVCLMPPFAGG